uniref:Uncharacterized protein n=1 Tax=Arundo donax TaxID=35708 RepID=A0A0A8YLV6_ARUDO
MVISRFSSICSNFSAPYLLPAEKQTRLAGLNSDRDKERLSP